MEPKVNNHVKKRPFHGHYTSPRKETYPKKEMIAITWGYLMAVVLGGLCLIGLWQVLSWIFKF
ncbi:MAG: hypothetical protein LC658_04790 [Bacteroidales bacterium]|nr:hypothetical protein [Bacteroidales bacterium]